METGPEPRPITHDDLHATYVERTTRELQRMIQEEGGVLAELRRSAGAIPIPSAAASLAIMKTAYDEAARADPFLPFADSVLPALLALRKTTQVAAESQAYLAASPRAAGRQQLAAETARRDDQQALHAALAARVAALGAGLETRSAMTAEQRRQAKLEALRARKRDFDRDTSVLLRALRQFIQQRLGPMLAAEALGGPVVGGLVDVQTEDLATGFSAQGKLRKPVQRAAGSRPDKEGRRQRRIDEIWGPQGGGRRGRNGGEGSDEEEDGNDDNDNDDDDDDNDDDGDDGDESGASRDEATAAAAEMQELTEELLNALASAGGDSSAAYVTLARESAAARFLVRSKVAQFHPRDATRLRLVDFGRELDD